MSALAERIRLIKRLTERQVWILQHLCRGLTYRQIAEEAQAQRQERISIEEIQVQAGQIFYKLGIEPAHNDFLRSTLAEFEAVLRFLDEHRRAPPELSQTTIQEVVFAPQAGGSVPIPREVADLACHYDLQTAFIQAVRRSDRPMDVTAAWTDPAALSEVGRPHPDQSWASQVQVESSDGSSESLSWQWVFAVLMTGALTAYVISQAGALFSGLQG
ncbi:MAG TPA: hypothetical protein VHL09_01510 [Dehalococcoidia bacterium]|nr:hypothetical protein [Dehalococcoidia bacterium]